jgi:plasmid stabilization system protein ParE
MKVYWASSAEQDRADIVEYIAQDNPNAAIQMDELIGKATRL